MFERIYSIFELSCGGPVRLDAVMGREAAITMGREIARATRNEIRVMYLPDNMIVAVFNREQHVAA